jgi:hypothetical protein
MSAARIGLVQAVDDPRLLGATLKLWPRQRELLASLDGPEGLHVWAIARQAGKTTLCAIAAVHNCTMREDLDDVLPRGRVRYALIVAPREEQAREFIRVAGALVEASPLLAGMAEIKGDRIEFKVPRADAAGRQWTARTAIRALPASSSSIRGMSASLVVADEYAHFNSTDGPADDARMLEALTPSTRVFGSAAAHAAYQHASRRGRPLLRAVPRHRGRVAAIGKGGAGADLGRGPELRAGVARW